MRRRYGLAWYALAAVALLSCRSPRRTPMAGAVECHATALRPSAVMVGDVVFFRTTTWRGQLVRSLQGGPDDFAHAGIVVAIDREIHVGHASPSSPSLVAVHSLRDLAARKEITSIAIYRPSADRAGKAKAGAVARGYAQRRIPFDFEFDLMDDREVYCTELIWRCYRTAGLKIEVSSGILFPVDLVRSGFFKPLECGKDGTPYVHVIKKK